jgi:hypothetical protein
VSPLKTKRTSGQRLCPLPGWIAVIAAIATGQVPTSVLNLPYGPITRLVSADSSHVLYGVPYQRGINDGPQLWIDNTRTGQRQMLLTIGGTLSAAWSADGSAFYVQDHWASDAARSYIYDANALQRLDLGSLIRTSDPETRRFVGHAYFDVDGWQGPADVIVHFHGHTDQSPVECFDFRYRVSRAGAVEKLSRQAFRVDEKNGCRE